MPENLISNLYLDEPRLKMTMIGRMMVRLIISCFYILFIAAVAVFLLAGISSDAKLFLWFGISGSLFLIHRLIHFGKAEKSFLDLKIKDDSKINIAGYLSPKTLSVLERAMEKASVTNTDIFLNLAKILIKDDDVREGLLRMDIPLKEFEQKIDDCQIWVSQKYRQSQTFHRLNEIYHCQLKPGPLSEMRADLVVVLGEKYWQKLTEKW